MWMVLLVVRMKTARPVSRLHLAQAAYEIIPSHSAHIEDC